MRRRKLAKLYDSFYEPIYRFIYFRVSFKEVAEDLSADVFLKFWRFAKKKKIENEKAFLYRVARSLVIDYYRKNKELSLEESNDRAVPDKNLIDLREALKGLNELEREVVLLHYFEGFSLREVSEIINKREGAAQVIVHRARKKLKEWL